MIYFLVDSYRKKLYDHDFERRFGSIYEGLKEDPDLIMRYNTIVVLRKVIIAFSVTLLGDTQGI